LDIISNAGGEVELRTIETLAADQSNFYLSVLRELIDDGTVIHTGSSIKKV
jgi:hypothetical protein